VITVNEYSMIFRYVKEQKNIAIAFAMLLLSLVSNIFESYRDSEDDEAVKNRFNYTLH
jgi:hypothetical protein